MEFNIHPYGTEPSNAEVKAKYKEVVLTAFKKRGYQMAKYPGSYTILMTKTNEMSVNKIEALQYSYGDMSLRPIGIYLKKVEEHLVEATKLAPPKNVGFGNWWLPTFILGSGFIDAPKPPSRAFESIEEAEAFFKSYVEYMETTGFDIVDYWSSLENMNEEMQKTHDIPSSPGILWLALGMAGVVRYYRGLIIANLCNKYFEDRLEKIYKELNYFIYEYPDPEFNEVSKGYLIEFEKVLTYIRQIKPIYNI